MRQWMLHDCASRGDKTRLAELLTEHNDPNEGNEIGERPLHLAALSGHKECCELLLENGADSGATTLKRQTPLHHAAIGGKADCISLLLEHGVDPDSTDGRGWTALHYAVESSGTDCVRNLLEGGADASPQTTSNLHQSGQHLQTTPLHLACSKGNLEIVLLLIRNGARIDVKDSIGEYPLSLLPVASPSESSSVAETTSIKETWKQRHTQQLAHNVSSLFNSSKYSDTTITIQDKAIPLHRCILYFRSDRLETILKDDATALVEDELTYEGFLGMIEYLYRGSLEAFDAVICKKAIDENEKSSVVSIDHIAEVLKAATKYSIIDLSEYSLHAINKVLNADNVSHFLADYAKQAIPIEVAPKSDSTGLESVRNAIRATCGSIIVNEFKKVSESKDFVRVDSKLLASILQHVSLSRATTTAANSTTKAKTPTPTKEKQKSKPAIEVDASSLKQKVDDSSKESQLLAPMEGKNIVMIKKLLKDLMRTQNASPFLQPVDLTEWPHYTTIIKKPMDLGTIKKKIDGSQYTYVSEVVDDVKLVFYNAMEFNMEGSWIHSVANKLLSGFLKKYRSIKLVASNTKKTDAKQAIKAPTISTESSKSTSKSNIKPTPSAIAPTSVPAPAPAPVTPTKRKSVIIEKPKKIETKVLPMSHEEKEVLGAKIGMLTEEQLLEFVNIMRKGNPLPSHHSEDIDDFEIDMDDLDDATLRRLEEYVNSCLAPANKKQKTKPESSKKDNEEDVDIEDF